ncbi:MAG: hypothetical protein ACRDQA_05645 [Nocardioidaceae bacterium]
MSGREPVRARLVMRVRAVGQGVQNTGVDDDHAATLPAEAVAQQLLLTLGDIRASAVAYADECRQSVILGARVGKSSTSCSSCSLLVTPSS